MSTRPPIRLILILGLALVGATSCTARSQAPKVVEQTVTLQVTADDMSALTSDPQVLAAMTAKTIQVTWDVGGAISQATADLPWAQPATGPVSFTAQNQDDAGAITCRILKGTTVLQESHADGAYGVCSVAWSG